MSLSPRNKASLKLSPLSSTSSYHHSQSPTTRAKAPVVGCDHPRGDGTNEEGKSPPPQTSSGDHHHQSSRSKTSDWEQECSMCGDVGFPSELFQCKKCLHRFQHTYCSRYYPSIPELDVCDWCSQDTNPSTGSSTATTTMTGSMKTPRLSPSSSKPPPSLVTNLGKRKVIAHASDYSPPSSTPSPRKNCSPEAHQAHYKSSRNTSTIFRTMIKFSSAKGTGGGDRNSNIIRSTSSTTTSMEEKEEEEHKDALELLLEVAQKVAAEGQMMNTTCRRIGGGVKLKKTMSSNCWDDTKQVVHAQHKQKQQQHHTQEEEEEQAIARHSINNNMSNNKSSTKTSSNNSTIQGSSSLQEDNPPASSKKHKLGTVTGSSVPSGTFLGGGGGGGGVKQEQQVGAASTANTKGYKLQLTSSRSIGRRYKLLSDVLCPKVAASNS